MNCGAPLFFPRAAFAESSYVQFAKAPLRMLHCSLAGLCIVMTEPAVCGLTCGSPSWLSMTFIKSLSSFNLAKLALWVWSNCVFSHLWMWFCFLVDWCFPFSFARDSFVAFFWSKESQSCLSYQVSLLKAKGSVSLNLGLRRAAVIWMKTSSLSLLAKEGFLSGSFWIPLLLLFVRLFCRCDLCHSFSDGPGSLSDNSVYALTMVGSGDYPYLWFFQIYLGSPTVRFSFIHIIRW